MTAKKKERFIQRSRMDIIASIITLSIDGARKTKLIYGCNLSFSQFNKYVDYLVKTGFLQKKTNREKRRKYETYQATQKGIEFLDSYRRLGEVLGNSAMET